jgi:hypothetical protein
MTTAAEEKGNDEEMGFSFGFPASLANGNAAKKVTEVVVDN